MPGVESAGIIDDLFSDNPREHVLTFERDSGIVSERLRLTTDEISADFFKALGTPLLRGRFFSTGDRPDAQRVAIINDAMARRSWPGQDPLGRRFTLGPRLPDTPWFTVVGVVGDIKYQGLDSEVQQTIYTPFTQTPFPWAYTMVRVTGEPATLIASIRGAAGSVELRDPAVTARCDGPGLPLGGTVTVRCTLADVMKRQVRFALA